MKRYAIPFLLMAALATACCTRLHRQADGQAAVAELSTIDSLMWSQPDSAFTQLLAFADTPLADSLDAFNGHYFHLLLSELLYKNDYAQTNRDDLLLAVAYFDSLCGTSLPQPGDPSRQEVVSRHVPAVLAFLDARSHYINGAGYYEMDSAVPACRQYLHALEMMETRFNEKDLVGHQAQFMALAYTRLTDLFSNQYLHEQAIEFGKMALLYFKKYHSSPKNESWILSQIGSQFFMLEQLDSSYYYYCEAEERIDDEKSLLFRDIEALLASLAYQQGQDPESIQEILHSLVSNTESRKEYISRCAVLGEFYYSEKNFDSAWKYLNVVFRDFASSDDSKKQAAEWLVEICKTIGVGEGIIEYADFLVPFANLGDNQSEIKSQLTFLYSGFFRNKEEKSHSLKIGHAKQQAVMVLVVLVVAFLILVLYNRKEKKAKQQIENDLKGQLKCSNQAIQDMQDELDTLSRSNRKTGRFEEEPVCKHLLEVCNDPKNPIKSTVAVSSYSNIALDAEQKIQLKEAAFRHYGPLIQMLNEDYPKLKDKDYIYCFLCLLGLDDVQIAVLMQRSYRTIWERRMRLQKLFKREDSIHDILLGFIDN